MIYHILSETSIPSLEETPNCSPKFPLETSHFLLVSNVSSKISFPLTSNHSYSDFEGYIQDDIQPMTVTDSFPPPFHSQKTQQPSSSPIGKSQNFLVSNSMSLVYVCFMSYIPFIEWKDIDLEFMGIPFLCLDLNLPPMVQFSNIHTLQVRSTVSVIYFPLVSHFGPIRSWRHHSSDIFYFI